jgi:2-polyprenyl-3-methyl-5-hydroxy-6-metoxy-1,4-benzoquinol methylase
MSNQQAVDQAKLEAFVGKVLADTSATMITMLVTIGDRLGLFKDLAAHGPSSASELADRAGIHERYAREWLGAMTSAGYIEYDAVGRCFTLPPEHALALAEESGPFFFGGVHQMIPAAVAVLGQVTEAFRKGGGVPYGAYDADWWDGMERFSNTWFENLLTKEWIPAMPTVQAQLQRGAQVADVGCGRGRALIKLAQAYPDSRYVGYDIFEPSIERASANARAAGVGDRVSFRQLDASKGLPEQYNVITTFDVIHDAADPLRLLGSIREGLTRDGVYVCLDINCSPKLEENLGPLGALFHGFSVLYCMTTSLGAGGMGLGTLGFHEPKVREMCAEAGFKGVRRVPLENPFNNLYEITP